MITLFDQFNRPINYLRISLTDHCNLRCVYCMPLHLMTFVQKEDLLNEEEIETIARAANSVGFRKFRLTGGEPTLRPELVSIVRRLTNLPDLKDLAMTTNGIRLPALAKELKAAGLRRVNIHVDTLDQDRLPKIMRWGSIDKIWAGIMAAEEAGFNPIKINCVVTRGYNDDTVAELARLTLEKDWHVRFIELMPLGDCANVAIQNFVSSQETMSRIEQALGRLQPLPSHNPNDESRNYQFANGKGVVGFISPVSQPYCDGCNRLRLTADGRIRLCLLTDHELDFRTALRAGASMKELQDMFREAVYHKPVGHQLRHGIHPEIRNMSQIGG